MHQIILTVDKEGIDVQAHNISIGDFTYCLGGMLMHLDTETKLHGMETLNALCLAYADFHKEIKETQHLNELII